MTGARARRGVWLPNSELPDGTPIRTARLRKRELTVLKALDDRQERAGGELVELDGLDDDTLLWLEARGLATLYDRDGFLAGGVTPAGDRVLERRGR